MANPAFQNRVRVAGSGFTIFAFGGQPIAFCQQVAVSSPQPVGQGVSAVHPMDEPYPVELITPAAVGMGTLVLNMFELFGKNGESSKVWDRLGAEINGSSENNPFGKFNSEKPEETSNTQLEWKENGVFAGAVDLVDIYIRQAQADPKKMNVTKYVRPLAATEGGVAKPYFESYIGCVITNVVDGEQVEVGTLEVLKQVTIAYRYATRNGKVSKGFELRDNQI